MCTNVRVFSYIFAILVFAIASPAAAQDSDGDGIDDAEDNCTAKANGSLPPGPDQERVLQRDTDLDGFGNVCDADFNNDGVKGGPDLVLWWASFGASIGDPNYDPEVDMNGDGVVGAPDLGLFAQQPFGGPPGPSGLACAGATTPCPAQNILILIADDVGLDNVGVYGVDPNAPETPEIDALAATGVRFTNAWGNPVCSPTRATALTGLFSFRTGIGAAIPGNDPTAFRLDPAHPSIARSLKATGYQTAAFGKWHLSTSCTVPGPCDGTVFDIDHPLEMGFDYYEGPLGNLGGLSDYCNWPKVELVRNPDGTVTELQNGASSSYAPTDTVQAAISRIGVMSEPWLAWVGFNLAHGPFHNAPPQPGNPCPMSTTGENPVKYDSMVERLDEEIADLLAAIPPEIRSRTTIIFVGDNGTAANAVSPPFDSTRAKGTVYQGGVTVPFIVKGRTVTAPPGGATSAALVNTTDVFATVASLAGFALPGEVLDSVSFAAHLSDAGLPSSRSSPYAEIFLPNGFGSHTRLDRAIRNGQYKLIRFDAKGFEGYDLLAGPHPSEASDLIPAPTQAERDALFCLAEEMSALQDEPWTYDDFDGDTLPNSADNCSLVGNPSQCNLDSPADAFGNHCDGDFNNDGFVGGPDLGAFAAHFGTQSGDPGYDDDFDMNCDGFINEADQGLFAFGAPGPAGCGGAIPCAGIAPDCSE